MDRLATKHTEKSLRKREHELFWDRQSGVYCSRVT